MKMLKVKKKNNGVSLIELMVSLSIMAILAAIASPNFTNWIGSLSVKNNSENIYAGLSLARTEALKTNQLVEFQLESNGSWKIVNPINSDVLKQNKLKNTDTINFTLLPSDANKISFNGFGIAVNNQDDSPNISQIKVSSNFGEDRVPSIELNILQGGSLSMCSTSSSSSNYCQ